MSHEKHLPPINPTYQVDLDRGTVRVPGKKKPIRLTPREREYLAWYQARDEGSSEPPQEDEV